MTPASSRGRPAGRAIPLLVRVAITLVVIWIAVDAGLPLVAMWIAGAPQPVPLPGFARALYLLLLVTGALVYVSASERSLSELRTAFDWLLRGPSTRARSAARARRAILVLIPLAVGALVWQTTRTREATPTAPRTQHPTLPQTFEGLRNPLRDLDDAARRAAISEGHEIFLIACRPCHGAAADGRGPMARGLRLKPADFTDPGTIASVVEAYAFWRVTEGGIGLPAEGTPWDSAMPAWTRDLSDLERWKALLGAYDVARAEPRKPERAAAGTAGVASSVNTSATRDARETDEGKRIYLARCAPCHGERGDGKGPVAPYLDPDPRDFSAGTFELRTTESGDPPTDDDLMRVVTNGIPGTAMPAWGGALSERERRAVIDYVKRFSDKFATKPTIVRPTKSVTSSASIVARGREVYQQAECWECHGGAGRADGPSAPTLKDDAGDRITAADLTKGWRLKGGREPADIFMRLTTGMDSTPMPSYADTLSEDDRWALAHFVRSLQTDADGGVVLRARRIAGDVPRTVDDARWRDAPPLAVPLTGQVIVKPRWQNHGVDEVIARALFDDRDIALLLEWNDPTRDVARGAPPGAPKLGRFGYVLAEERDRDFRLPDGVRLQFARANAERPHFLLGQRGRPVELWHWRADAAAVVTERAEGTEQPPVEVRSTPVESRATWDGGRWQIVFVRRLEPNDPARDVTFTRGALTPFAIHAWDGSRGERDLMMSISSWSYLLLEPAPSAFAPIAGAVAVAFVGLAEWALILRARRRASGLR